MRKRRSSTTGKKELRATEPLELLCVPLDCCTWIAGEEVNGEEAEPVITVRVLADGVDAIVIAALDALLDCCAGVDVSKMDIEL